MRIIHVSPAERERDTGEIFLGMVDRQSVIGDESAHLRLTEVTFRLGARNRLHVHETDQVLVITAGEGIVATEHEQHEVKVGDVAFIPAGEPHWHGARGSGDMTHWAILGPGKTTIVG